MLSRTAVADREADVEGVVSRTKRSVTTNCLPGENLYGCDIPSTNDRVCAIDDVTALGLCPPGSNAKLLAVCSHTPPGTGGQGGGGPDGAQGGTASTPPPGVDESAGGSAAAGGKP